MFLREKVYCRRRARGGGRKQKSCFSFCPVELTSSSSSPAACEKRQKEPGPIPAGPQRSRLPARSERRGREWERREEREEKKHEQRRRRRRRFSPQRRPGNEGGEGEGSPFSRFRSRRVLPRSSKPKSKLNRPALGSSLESPWFLLSKCGSTSSFGRYFSLPKKKEKVKKKTRERERGREGGRSSPSTPPSSSKNFDASSLLSPPKPPSSSFLLLLLHNTTPIKMPNPVVFFDITADGAPLGRIEMTVSCCCWRERERKRKSFFFDDADRMASDLDDGSSFLPLLSSPRADPLSPSSQCTNRI